MNQNNDSLTSNTKYNKPVISTFRRYWDMQFLDSTLEDWLTHLKQHNKLRWTNVMLSLFKGFALPSDVIKIIYHWCQQLKQPIEVLYRTVDIYEQYVETYLNNSITPKTEEDLENMSSQAQNMLVEIRHQSLLHLASCLQIASKLEDGYKVVTVADAAALLREAHRPCDPTTITRSEILILVTLNYNVNCPPISDFVDICLCQLIIDLKKKPVSPKFQRLLTEIDGIHELSLLFIKAIYFNRQEIFQSIVSSLYRQFEDQASNYHEHVRKIRHDKMLLATGAVSAAVFFLEPNASADVMKELHLRTEAHLSDMAVVSSVLVTYLEL